MGKDGRFSFGWVLISYFLVAGGFVLAGSVVAIFEISSSSRILGYLFLFIGAAVGGFFAGRASPGSTIVEPGFGALLLFLSLFALMAIVPGVRDLITNASESGMMLAALSGLVVGGGGFFGGVLGEKSSKGPSHSKVRWLFLAGLISLGAMFVVSMVLAILVLRHTMQGGAEPGENVSGLLGVAILALSAFLGGAVTQAAAPKRMLLVSGSGFALVLLAFVPLTLSSTKGTSDLIVGLLVLAPVSILVGALGALLAWAFKRGGLKQADMADVFE